LSFAAIQETYRNLKKRNVLKKYSPIGGEPDADFDDLMCGFEVYFISCKWV
jgi:hypothetical protein